MGFNRMHLNFKLVFCFVAMPCQAVDHDHFLAKKKKQTLSVDVQDVESAPVEASQDHESSASGWLQLFSAAGLSRVFNLLDADEVLEPDRFDHGLNDNAAVGTREEYPWLAEERERKRLKSALQHQHHEVATAPSHTPQLHHQTQYVVDATASASPADDKTCRGRFLKKQKDRDEHGRLLSTGNEDFALCESQAECSWDFSINSCVDIRCDLIRESGRCMKESSHPGLKCDFVVGHCVNHKLSRKNSLVLNDPKHANSQAEEADDAACQDHFQTGVGGLTGITVDKLHADDVSILCEFHYHKQCWYTGETCVAKSSVTTCDRIRNRKKCNAMPLDDLPVPLKCLWDGTTKGHDGKQGRCIPYTQEDADRIHKRLAPTQVTTISQQNQAAVSHVPTDSVTVEQHAAVETAAADGHAGDVATDDDELKALFAVMKYGDDCHKQFMVVKSDAMKASGSIAGREQELCNSIDAKCVWNDHECFTGSLSTAQPQETNELAATTDENVAERDAGDQHDDHDSYCNSVASLDQSPLLLKYLARHDGVQQDGLENLEGKISKEFFRIESQCEAESVCMWNGEKCVTRRCSRILYPQPCRRVNCRWLFAGDDQKESCMDPAQAHFLSLSYHEGI